MTHEARGWQSPPADGSAFAGWLRAEDICAPLTTKRRPARPHASQAAALSAQECEDLREAVRELGQLRQTDLSDKQFLLRENRKQGKKLEATLDLVRDRERDLIEQEQTREDDRRELGESASLLREEVERLRASNEEKEHSLQQLAERNEELRLSLQDRSDAGLCTLVQVVDRYDLLLSRYMDTFPQDQRDMKVQFVDKVTKRSNTAFRLLANKCREELVCNHADLVHFFPDPESFVEAVFDLDLDLQALHYLRVVQCMTPSLFDTMESTLVRQHDLTRNKIHFRQTEINQARLAFLQAFLEVWRKKNLGSSPGFLPGQPAATSRAAATASRAAREFRPSSSGETSDGPVGF